MRSAAFVCFNPGCDWISLREADLQEHYRSSHSSGSCSIRDPSLGDFTSPSEVGRCTVLVDRSAFSGTSGSFTPSAFDNFPESDGLSFFDGSVGGGNNGCNEITTSFSTHRPERSITRNSVADFDVPTINPFDYGRTPTKTGLNNSMFAGNPAARPSTATSAYSINTNGTYQGNIGWNPNPASFLTYESGFADYPNTNDSDSAIPQESRPDVHEPGNPPSSSSSPVTSTRPRVPCLHCSKTFARQADMKRHARKHDSAAVKLSCRVAGCVYVGERGFLRADKLRSHMKSVHGI